MSEKAKITAIVEENGDIQIQREGTTIELLAICAALLDRAASDILDTADGFAGDCSKHVFATFAATIAPGIAKIDEYLQAKAHTSFAVLLLAKWDDYADKIRHIVSEREDEGDE